MFLGAPISELPDGAGASGSLTLFEYRLSRKLDYFLEQLTLGAAATKGATALTVGALVRPIPSGVILHFDSGNANWLDALVTADVAVAATTIPVVALEKALAIGIKANWDGYVLVPSTQAPKVDVSPEFDTQKVTTGGRRGAWSIKTKVGNDGKFSFTTTALDNHPFIAPLVAAGLSDGDNAAIDFRMKRGSGTWLYGSGFVGVQFEDPERGTVKTMFQGEVSGPVYYRAES